MRFQRQKGAALLIAVFVIIVIGGTVGAMVALTSTTQQITSARNMQATGAFYAARARLEREINTVADTSGHGNSCPDTGASSDNTDDHGFTTRLVDDGCERVKVDEGGVKYEVYYLRAAAFDGSRASGTLVRRELEAVVRNEKE
jgi:Tfp pilus assembly protein PilX